MSIKSKAKTNTFEIDFRLNYILKNIQNQETQTIIMTVPDMEIKNLQFKAAMLVRNLTDFNETVSIRKQQNCDCKAIPVSVSLTRRKRVFKCPHRLMSNLSLNKDVLQVFGDRLSLCFTVFMGFAGEFLRNSAP